MPMLAETPARQVPGTAATASGRAVSRRSASASPASGGAGDDDGELVAAEPERARAGRPALPVELGRDRDEQRVAGPVAEQGC
jgi:hypothetical protein